MPESQARSPLENFPDKVSLQLKKSKLENVTLEVKNPT